jgi:ApaG protein
VQLPTAVTHGIRVTVRVTYSDAQSDPARRQWFYLYTIRIANEGERPMQLISRHWIIEDARGEVREVRGPGVVGQQPTLNPGEGFEYTSGCPLETPFGAMRGSYQMVDDQGRPYEVQIPPFPLRRPGAEN